MRTSSWRSVGTLCLLLGAPCVWGCGGAPEGPESSLHALAEALRRGDAPAAHALMSRRYRERVPLVELERILREQPEEVRATADALDHPVAIEEEARARLPNGEEIVIERTDGAWRVVTDVADYYARGIFVAPAGRTPGSAAPLPARMHVDAPVAAATAATRLADQGKIDGEHIQI